MGVDRIERERLPSLHLIGHSIGHRGDQAGRHLGTVHFLQVRLDLAHCHAAGIERENLVVEAPPAGLVLLDDLRIEGAIQVARHFDGQLAELALEFLLAETVARVTSGVADRLMLVVPRWWVSSASSARSTSFLVICLGMLSAPIRSSGFW